MEFRPNPPKDYRGATDDEVAVRIFGRDKTNGRWDIQLNVKAPESPDDDPNPSEQQSDAVARIFPHIPREAISEQQAHALLCYRDYAKAVVERVIPDFTENDRQIWTIIIATLVSHDERVAKDVRKWSEDRFRLARSDDRIVTTKHFADLVVICRQIAKEMKN